MKKLVLLAVAAALMCVGCVVAMLALAGAGCDGGFRPIYQCNPADFHCTQPFWQPPPFWDGARPFTDDAGIVVR